MSAERRLNPTEVAILLSLHRAGSGTRTKIAKALGFGSATAFRASEGLISSGWILETTRAASSAGRRARPIVIAPDAAHVLAFNLSADRADIAIVAANMTIAATTSLEVDLRRQGPEVVFERLKSAAAALIRRVGLKEPTISGIGIAMAGVVHSELGSPVMPSGLPLWHGYHIGSLAHELWGVPAVVDNDANLCALGEMFRGGARESRNFIYVHLDIGIGAGLVIERQLYRGSTGLAGEIGHVRVPGATRQCPCGKVGCLQAVASAPAVIARARTRSRGTSGPLRRATDKERHLTLADIAAAAKDGDEIAIEVISEAGLQIGQVLAGASNLISPDQILVGGGMAVFGPRLIAAMRRSLMEDGLPGSGHQIAIDFAELGEHAALMGAAALAVERVIVDSAAAATPSAAEKLSNHPIASLVS